MDCNQSIHFPQFEKSPVLNEEIWIQLYAGSSWAEMNSTKGREIGKKKKKKLISSQNGNWWVSNTTIARGEM